MKRKLSLLFTVLMTVILAVCLFPLAVSAAETNEPTVSIDRYNLVFDDNVYLKYAVKFDGVADSAITADNIGILYFTSPQDEYTKENAAHSARVVGYVILDEQKYYTFENRKISAKNMTDYVYSVAYVELDGEIYYSAPNKYSVLEYAYSKLGKTGTASENEDYRNLLEATLTQGAMAQKYFGYNTERLANDEYYRVEVDGGTLEDGFAFGLYHTGETATLTAPETKENLIFSGWTDADGNLISSENPLVLTSFDANKTYVASYAPKYSEGLKFVSNNDGTCYVAGIGTCTDTELRIPPTSPEGDKVTEIGSNAFQACSNLTSVVIPDSVTSIGSNAFNGCTSLTSVVISDSVISIGNYAFHYCTSLTSAVIGDSVTSVGSYVFCNCTSLTSVVIGDSVESIGEQAFRNCKSLTSVVIPDSVTSIDFDAFYCCTSLASVVIGNSVESIGNWAFSQCDNLESVVIPDSVESIGILAFEDCASLTSVVIGNSVTSIGTGTFSDCTSLESIVLPDSVTSIGDHAFAGCSSLASVVIGDSVTSIGEYAFYGCSSLASVVIGDSVTSIGKYAFFGCDNKDVYIIDVEAWLNISFGNYSSHPNYYGKLHVLDENGDEVTNLVIPEGITLIPDYTFINCTSTSVVIPDSVTSIGYQAFYNCISLTSVEFKNADGWFVSKDSSATSGTEVDVANEAQNVTYLNSTYATYYWKRDTNVHVHTPSEVVRENVIEATCVTPGSYDSVVYCSSCGEELSRENVTITAAGHSFTNYVSNGDATCTEDGTKTAKCDRCDATDTQAAVDSALGHVYVKTTYPATCIAEGKIVYECSVCSGIYEEVIPGGIDKNFHEVNKTTTGKPNQQITTAPTCTEYGVLLVYCGACNFVESYGMAQDVEGVSAEVEAYLELIRPIEHDWKVIEDDDVNYPHVDATCGTPETWYEKCGNCGEISEQKTGCSLGHKLEVAGFENATCTTDAKLVYTCTVCTTYTEEVAGNNIDVEDAKANLNLDENGDPILVKYGHNYDGQMTDANYQCPDCSGTLAGWNMPCNNGCGITEFLADVNNPYDKTNPDHHVADTPMWEDEVNGIRKVFITGTCTTQGYYWNECTSCHEHYYVVADDNSGKGCEYYKSNVTPAIPATCYSEGFTEGYTCLSCGMVYASVSLGLIPHIEVVDAPVSATCTKTGLTEGSHCAVCKEVFVEQIIIPVLGHDYVDGVCTNCGDVKYSEGLKFVSNGDGTCYVAGIGTCEDTDLIIPPTSPAGDTVTSIGDDAFMSCSSITSVVIGESVESICKNAFACSSLVSIVIGDSVTSIGTSAFSCSNLTSVVIGESVENIGRFAFDNCCLTSVVIPASVESIGDGAFYWCHNLLEITVEENNQYYKDIEGNLYSKDGKTLVQYSIGKKDTSFTIPESVENIGFGAFDDCINLTKVKIPNSVTNISQWAFQGCCELMNVEIPDSVTSIGNGAFAYCSSLTSVVIENSVTSIGKNAFHYCDSLTSVTLKNTDGWYVSEDSNATSGSDVDVTDEAQNATFLKSTYVSYYWKCDANVHTHTPAEAVIENQIEATCITPGSCDEVIYCSECGEELSRENKTTTILGHLFGEPEYWLNGEKVDSYFCTDVGVEIRKGCIRKGCDLISVENLQPGEHDFESDGSYKGLIKSPTCLEYGIYREECARCSYVFEDLISIFEDGGVSDHHTWEYSTDSATGYVAPTCDSSGLATRATCSICGVVVENLELSALGHNTTQSHSDPDCIVTGYTALWCKRCGEDISVQNFEALGHNYVDGVCTRCEVRPEWLVNRTSLGGNSIYDSAYIQTFEELQEYLAQNGLTEDETLNKYAREYFEDNTLIITGFMLPAGYKSYVYCDIDGDVCSIYLSRYTNPSWPIPAYIAIVSVSNYAIEIPNSIIEDCHTLNVYEHWWNDKRQELTQEYQLHKLVSYDGEAPTCTEVGWYEYESCLLCSYTTYEEIPKLGHDYVDGVCTNCGDVKYSEGLKFVSNGDGTCYVAGIGTCEDTDIVIPPTSPEGDKVTSIGDHAFRDCASLTSIVIPDYVESIGAYAFAYCDSLASIVIGDSVTSIGSHAFFQCDSLASIVVENNVTSIGAYAFTYSNSLVSIVIGDSVESIGDEAFAHCVRLTSIEVDENNQYYKDIDGNLYSKNGKTLIQYAIGKAVTSFTIPDTVTSIGDSAFYGCTRLTSIVIPDDVESIGDGAFRGCRSLKSIVIPDNVESIGIFAFYDCDDLTNIVIPDRVASIGRYTFAACDSLVSVVIPDSVETIGPYAFSDCDSLMSVVIENGVDTIGPYAFKNCTSLTSVEFKNTAGWFVSENEDATSGTDVNVTDTARNATHLKSTYFDYYWKRDTSVHTHVSAEAVEENRVEPTCTENGSYDSVVYCSSCGEELSRENVTITAAGHSFTNYVSNGDATCTEDGTKTAKCDRCDATDTQAAVDSALGHAYVKTTYPATCIAEGKIVYECSVCSGIYEEVIPGGIKADWHEVNKYSTGKPNQQITTKPTCTEYGALLLYCDECGFVKSYTIADDVEGVSAEVEAYLELIRPIAHNWETIEGDTNYPHVDATCGTPETWYEKCLNCGEISEQKTGSSLGHKLEVAGFENATCTTDAKLVYTCTVCTTYTEEVVGNKIDVEDAKAKLNLDENGDPILVKYGHNYVDGQCTKCGEQKITIKDEDSPLIPWLIL